MTTPWWRSAVLYQVYPRSFADGNADGVGDLAGLTARLDHLQWLGVDGLWLSPIYPSPMADFGYDVSDYCAVDPVFGTLADVDALVAAAHERSLRVILDWVPNHTSDQHPWFRESRSSPTNPKRDWYVWRDPAPGGGPPNNWLSTFTGNAPAWTFDEATGQYYLHQFLPAQPDLNWEHPEVAEAMHGVLRFWLDRGVDGFRVDVVQGLGRDLDRDDPPQLAGIPHSAINDSERTHPIVRGIRRVIDEYHDRLLLGEVFLLSIDQIARYYGHGDELMLAFNFPFMFTAWEGSKLRRRIERTLELLDPVGAWPCWVLSNHDRPRHRTRHGHGEAGARAAAVLLLTLPGTPLLYQGEELGLEDAVVPPEQVVDPGGRDGCRAPMPWDGSPLHGWPARPWLPFPPSSDERNVATEQADPASVLHLYRRLLQLRRSTPALATGTFAWLDAPGGVLAYERGDGTGRVWVVVNASAERQSVAMPGAATVLVASDGAGEGGTYCGSVEADTAVVLSPEASPAR